MKIIPGTNKKVPTLCKKLVIAVDLGMSDGGRTTGIWSTRGLPMSRACVTFGEAVKCIKKLLNGDHNEATLILEAPLSGTFTKSGDPTARSNLETNPARPWHHQPAAGLGLLAILFLQRVMEACEAREASLHLYEGFVTGDFRGHGKNRTHRRDAYNLAKAFSRPDHEIKTPPNGAKSLLPLAAPHISRKPPAVIQVSAANYQTIVPPPTDH